MRLEKKQGLVYSILALLLMVAPVLAMKSACATFWGEPEVPESLR
jgi:cyclic lactone autoinducer peptide